MSAKLTGLVWELDLPQKHAWILMSLCDHAEHDGTRVFPGNGFTAWKTGFSVSTVKRVLRELRDDYDLIETVKEGGGTEPAEYRIKVENFGAHQKEPLAKRGRPNGKTPVRQNPVQESEKPGSENGGQTEPGSNGEKPGSHSRAHDDRNRPLEPSGSRRGADAPEGESEKSSEPHRADTYFAAFCRDVKRMDIALDDRERQSIPGNLNQLILKHNVGPPEMWRVVSVLVSAFGAGRVVSPQQALRQVRGEKFPDNRRGRGGSIAVVGATQDDYREEDYNFHV